MVDDRLRGRVMGFYSLVFMGLLPVGNLLVGQVAHRVGVVTTVTLCAGVTAACSVAALLLFPRVRRLE
jgi:hypothetical protein